VAKWDRVGVHTQVVGPALVYLFFSTVQFLDRFTAGPDEYLIVTRKDGSVEHNRGPLSMFKNPVFHTSISVHTCFTLLSASEVIVVNRDTSQRASAAPSGMVTPVSVLDPTKAQVKVLDARDEKHEGIRRLIVSGPATFFPQVSISITHTYMYYHFNPNFINYHYILSHHTYHHYISPSIIITGIYLHQPSIIHPLRWVTPSCSSAGTGATPRPPNNLRTPVNSPCTEML
jgi:hypothetical protein